MPPEASPPLPPHTQFLDNGGCGYVKKPDWLLDASREQLPERTARHLSVTVFSAHLPQVLSFCH